MDTLSALHLIIPVSIQQGGRLWEFAVGLLLAGVWPNSILLTALFGLSESLTIVIFGGSVGQYVKKNVHDRVGVVRKALVTQNSSIAACALCILAILQLKSEPGGVRFSLLSVLIILFGCIARLAAVGSTIAIEKDWVARLCKNDEERLARKQLDVSCLHS